MHKSKGAEKLIRTFEPATASWQSALRLFQRSLLEAGTGLSVEHSQRLGLLFSKRVGHSDDVCKWASLFNAEDVPTCSMMLKALVFHGNWKTAMQLFEWSSDTRAFSQLGEHLAQFMLASGLEKESITVATKLVKLSAKSDAEHGRPGPAVSPNKGALENNSLVSSTQTSEKFLIETVVHDIIGMSHNPVYVPLEEETCYCGLGSAVFRAYPKNGQWCDAAALLSALGKCASGKTKLRLAEYEYARKEYGGYQHSSVRNELLALESLNESPTLLRILLHAALEMRDLETSLNCLDALTTFGQHCVPSSRFDRFVSAFTVTHSVAELSPETKRRFIHVVVSNYDCICKAATRKQIATFFSRHGVDVSVLESIKKKDKTDLDVTSSQSEKKKAYTLWSVNDGANTIADLDRKTSVALQHGKWREALLLIGKIENAEATSPREKVIQNAVLDNKGDWEKTLLFFS